MLDHNRKKINDHSQRRKSVNSQVGNLFIAFIVMILLYCIAIGWILLG